jgi:hypothetical protein
MSDKPKTVCVCDCGQCQTKGEVHCGGSECRSPFITRTEFLKLPMRERRKILRAQADVLLETMPNYPEDLWKP